MAGPTTLREGERRFVSVLFADMKDYTALSEKLDPEEIDGVMSELFSEFESIVERHDGTVEKYIGDAMVAVFGVPVIHEDDPVRAVNAAFDFLGALHRRNEDLAERGLHISFRIGINTGLITTGKRGQFDVITGHAMAVAARLESAAPYDSIFVSQSTKEKCEKEFVFSEPYEVQAKGSNQPIRAFLVRGRNPDPLEHDSVFVGREELLNSLITGYLKHTPTEVGGCFLTGPPGVGKTRLAAQCIDRVRQFPRFSATCLYARALKFRSSQFGVITDLLRSYLDRETRESAESIARYARDELGLDDGTSEEFAAFLSAAAHPRDDNRSFLLLYAVVKRIIAHHEAGPYPVLVFIDNAGFMDQESRDFFLFFLRNAEVKPFFLLADRELDQELCELFHGIRELAVPPLSADESRRLLSALWPNEQSQAHRETIIQNALGYPLFMKEYARYARENRDVSSLPTTIQNIFLTSVESYPRDQRDLLRKLSVFVHSFTTEDAIFLQEKTDGQPDAVPEALARFLTNGVLIQERELYMFKHDLFKQALYNSLLNYNKRILHQLIAARMRSFAAPHLLRLCHHLSRAEDYGELRQVVLNAAEAFVNPALVPYLDTLLEHTISDDYAGIIEYLFHKSAILFNNGATDDAYANVHRMLHLALHRREPGFAAQAYHLLTGYYVKTDAFDKAYVTGTKALRYYESGDASGQPASRGDPRSNVLRLMVVSELLRNRPEESDRLLSILEEHPADEPRELLSARLERALIRSRYAEGCRILDEAPQELSEDRAYRSTYRYFQIMMRWLSCDYEGALESYHRGSQQEWHSHKELSQLNAIYAACTALSGGADDLESHLHQSEFHLLQLRNDFDRVDSRRTLAESLLICGSEEKAEEVALEAITGGLRHSTHYPTFTLLMILVEIAHSRDREHDARFFLEEARFYVELTPMLRNRDLVLYHYFSAQYAADGEAHCRCARERLQQEQAGIGDQEHFERLLKVRSFGKVAEAVFTSA